MNALLLKQFAQAVVGLLLLIAFVWLAFYALIAALALLVIVSLYVCGQMLYRHYIHKEPSAYTADSNESLTIETTDYQDITKKDAS